MPGPQERSPHCEHSHPGLCEPEACTPGLGPGLPQHTHLPGGRGALPGTPRCLYSQLPPLGLTHSRIMNLGYQRPTKPLRSTANECVCGRGLAFWNACPSARQVPTEFSQLGNVGNRCPDPVIFTAPVSPVPRACELSSHTMCSLSAAFLSFSDFFPPNSKLFLLLHFYF